MARIPSLILLRPQKQKVGICGRTGSGKSTLALSFFRFIEATSGRIVIDGLDIATLKLSDLRSRLNIIPQESTLFSGTIRFNLDPFNSFEDSEVWDALRRVKMVSPLGQSANGSGVATPASGDTLGGEGGRFPITSLDMVVSDGGKNFSTGKASRFISLCTQLSLVLLPKVNVNSSPLLVPFSNFAIHPS